MARFINQSDKPTGSGTIKSVSEIKMMATEVRNKVTIPMYFYRIIIPQMGNYFDDYPVNFDGDPRACCPLHDEDTPSFRYYEATSSFYCFGCNKGGDVIALHRYFAERQNGNKPDRDAAVAFLYNYFIENNDSAEFIDASTQTIKKEKLNTDAEIVKFNIYRFNLEQQVSFDRTLKLSVKEQLWDVLDKIDCLLSLDMIKASEAEQFLKSKVNEIITFDADIKKMRVPDRTNGGENGNT